MTETPHLLQNHAITESRQRLRGVVDLTGDELHFEGAPCAGSVFHHHVHFKAGVVPIVVDGRIQELGCNRPFATITTGVLQ